MMTLDCRCICKKGLAEYVLQVAIYISAALGLCLLLYFKLKRKATTALFIKSGVSFLFVLLAVWGATRPAVYESGLGLFAFFVVMGAVMGLLGDTWLGQRPLHESHKRSYLMAGFCAFSLGHLLYGIGAFVSFGAGDFSLILWPVIIALVMVVVIRFTEKPLKLAYGKFRPFALIYTFIITTAVVLSLAISFMMRDSTLWPLTFCFALGIVLILLSDLVLSQRYFSKHKQPEIITAPLNLILYYGGQFAIASSLLLVPVV